ncbi:ATP-binding protein [Streptomyces sp. NPDC001904]|uniref:ATP-binding protein n=1 Tax=Streptomyces sp. NPDC001904 TaxID=3154531 RepID=UPI003325E598
MHQHRMHLALGDHSARHIRRIVRAYLHRWALTELTDTAELAVTELLANVVRHVPGRFCSVLILRVENGLRVEVTDPDPRLPEVQQAGQLAEHGRGLMLVEALTDRWGTTPSPPGKTVWFECDAKNRDGAAPAPVRG